MYTDPAANFSFGAGFTSTAWYAQRYDAFWAGNVPLHALLLGAWLKLVPFGPSGVRSLNFLLVALAVVFFWRASERVEGFTPSLRLALCLLLLCGYGVTFSYRRQCQETTFTTCQRDK